MLKIFQQRVSSDIGVVRKYKYQGITSHCLKSVPSPLNDKIYKNNHADISQVNFKQGVKKIVFFILFKYLVFIKKYFI